MTTAEMLQAKGRLEGETRGRAEGRVEGRVEGQVEMLTQLLTVKFGDLPDDAHAQLRAATAEQLVSWSRKMLTAESLDEVLG